MTLNIDNLTQNLIYGIERRRIEKKVVKIFTVSAPVGWTPGSGEPKTLFNPLVMKFMAIRFVSIRFDLF